MPLYEYKCSQCGTVFEVRQKFSDQRIAVHEGCGGAVERLLSASAFRFKGSGFYITDYAKGSKGKNGSKKKEESAAPAAKTESPSSKSASDPPAKG
jgi:putative FmdB family regulatory protein